MKASVPYAPLTPPTFYPEVTLDAAGHLCAGNPETPGSPEALLRGMEFASIAVDELARPLFGRRPVEWQEALIAHLERHLKAQAATRKRGMRDGLRLESAAATILLNIAEGTRRGSPLGRHALSDYLELMEQTVSHRLRESMILNLQRARQITDDSQRARLDCALELRYPVCPPYVEWFGEDSKPLRIVAQIQDAYFDSYRRFLHSQGFVPAGGQRPKSDKFQILEKRSRPGEEQTTIRMQYRQDGDGLFMPMSDPEVGLLLFVGNSDWWARVPRNLKCAPNQQGAKLLVLSLCHGNGFLSALRERYPTAQVLTRQAPSDSPEEHPLLRHLFEGICRRQTWAQIQRAAERDAGDTDKNILFPHDREALGRLLDFDYDGRANDVDRYCNLHSIAPERGEPGEGASLDEGYQPAALELDPRGVELDPRELAGDKVFEAALILNALASDNPYLAEVNREQRVVGQGWHLPVPGEFAATRQSKLEQGGRESLRLTVSVRHAHAPQSAVSAMVVFEGWRHFAPLLALPLDPVDEILMGVLLVADVLGHCDYPDREKSFAAFLRRYGLPVMDLRKLSSTIDADANWPSGSPASLTRLRRLLPRETLAWLAAATASLHEDRVADEITVAPPAPKPLLTAAKRVRKN